MSQAATAPSRQQLRLRSIARALAPWPEQSPLRAGLVAVAPTVMMELIRTWLPLVGAALVLHGSRLVAQRVLPSRTAGLAAGAQASTHRP